MKPIHARDIFRAGIYVSTSVSLAKYVVIRHTLWAMNRPREGWHRILVYGRKLYGTIRYLAEPVTGTVRSLRCRRPGSGYCIYGTVRTSCTGYGAQPYHRQR
jgi:hypothetical protein